MATGNFGKFQIVGVVNGKVCVSTFASFPWAAWLGDAFLPAGWDVKITNFDGSCNWPKSVRNKARLDRIYKILSQVGNVSVSQFVFTREKETRIYYCFLVPGGTTGKTIAVLEADMDLNSTYLFRAYMANWKAVAECTKQYVRDNRFRLKEYVKKLNHSLHFDKNLRNLIGTL